MFALNRKWIFYILFALLIGFSWLNGQKVNPFEIVQKNGIQNKQTQKDSLIAEAVNPFELIEAKNLPEELQSKHKNKLEESIDRALSLRSGSSELSNILFWLLLFLVSLLALAVNLNRNLIAKLYKTSFNLNQFNNLYRENMEENRLVFPLLYGLYFAGISIFIFLALNTFRAVSYIPLIFYITCLILLIYLIRHLSLKLLASIFKIGKEVDHYLFNIVCFGSLMAIIFIPLNFIIAFLKPAWGKNIIILVAVFYVLSYIFRQIKEILSSTNLWTRSIMHFILYLCAFEIAPLVYLYIYLQRQGWV